MPRYTTRRSKKRRTTRRRKPQKQRGGVIANFQRKYDNVEQKKTLRLLGSGGAGSVYIDPDQPEAVFKVSRRADICREWGKEQKIYTELNKFDLNTDKVKILKMIDFKVADDDSGCILELTRVVNPLGEDANYTIQIQLGVNSLNYKNRARGQFYGVKEIVEKEILLSNEINDYVKDLGTVIGRLHYVAKNDGYDIEVFAGKDGELTVIYIGDFDLSEMIKEYDNPTIERMSWCLAAVPYFPIKDQVELYGIFKDAYLAVAKEVDQEEAALRVLEKYEE